MSEDTSTRTGALGDLKKIFGSGSSNLRQFGILFSLIAIILLFQFLTDGLTLSSGNLINLVEVKAPPDFKGPLRLVWR